MDGNTRRLVAFVASQLVFVAALIHVAVGAVNWIRWLSAGFLLPQDARWPVFVLSGLAVIVGIYAASRAENRRPYYLAGVVVMLGYVVAYFGWHLGGHRLFLVAGPAAGNAETITVQWFLDHLFAGAVEFVSILVETVAAVALAVLYVTAGEQVSGDEPDDTGEEP